MKVIKLTESQLKRILNEVGGYDSVDMMASHGGLVHGEISMRTMNLIQMLQDISQKMMEGSLSKHELLVGTYNLNSAINEYMERINILSNEVYIDDDFSGMSGMGMDMTKDQLALNIAKKISPLQDHIEKIGDMIPTIVRRFTDRMNNLNEQRKKKTPEVNIRVGNSGSSIISDFTFERNIITLKGKKGIGNLSGYINIIFEKDPLYKIKRVTQTSGTSDEKGEVEFSNENENNFKRTGRVSIIKLPVDNLTTNKDNYGITELLLDKVSGKSPYLIRLDLRDMEKK